MRRLCRARLFHGNLHHLFLFFLDHYRSEIGWSNIRSLYAYLQLTTSSVTASSVVCNIKIGGQCVQSDKWSATDSVTQQLLGGQRVLTHLFAANKRYRNDKS